MNQSFENELQEAFRVEKEHPRTPPKTPRTPGSILRQAKTPSCDRFIPCRSIENLDFNQYKLEQEEVHQVCSPVRNELRERLIGAVFDGSRPSEKIFSYKQKAPPPKSDVFGNSDRVLYTSNRGTHARASNARYISQNAERVLDAPNVLDDYYVNIIDWGSENHIALALLDTLYIWNATTGETKELFTTANNMQITSVSWAKGNSFLSVGLHDGSCQLWDVSKEKQLRTLRGHYARVSSSSWNNCTLTTGSRDTSILNHDVRIREHVTSSLLAHEQEVCGLSWNKDGSLLASGGNDNLVCIWKPGQTAPQHELRLHRAAVKAVAWCPWQKELLATGGGTADRSIKFWNANNGVLLNSLDTNSQVSSLLWSPSSNTKEIISSHGFSQYQMTIWKYPSLQRVGDLRGHDQRILSMVASPDGERIASVSADETLRIWKVFGNEHKNPRPSSDGSERKVISIR